MKITLRYLLLCCFTATLFQLRGADDSIPAAVPVVPPGDAELSTNNNSSVRPSREERQARRAEREARRAARRQNSATPGGNAPLASASLQENVPAPQPTPEPVEPEEADLRLNFRGVSLDVVLDYLSEAAGYTIVLETPVKGTVDVWSNQPLTKTEALNLLNSVLNKNGFAAIQNGKTLTVVARDVAKKRDIPIRIGSAHEEIPRKDQMITQVIPVRNINVTQLARDLAPLIANSDSVVANEGANTLLVTDTQANIRRFAELIDAL
ncbi:MAG: secretin N-terminal domain-containing protein, partial [Limisphaerales bacterium]